MKKLIIINVFFTIALLVLGIITAAFGACLGCPDWPLCYGSVLPPENFTAKLEYYHRLVAAIVGVLSIIIGITYFKNQKLLSSLLIFLIISQILVGGLTVILRMPFVISMSHAILAVSTYIVLLLLYKNSYKFKRNFWTLAFILIFIYYVWGAVVDKTSSKLACENILCLSSNFQDLKVIIQFAYQTINLTLIFFSFIFLKDVIFSVLMISIFIANIFVIKSLLSVSMVTIHYILTLLALTTAILKSIKEVEKEIPKASEV
ncbi:MAG: COX15/CtaA family protein [candidate division WOR-3 bacterium]